MLNHESRNEIEEVVRQVEKMGKRQLNLNFQQHFVNAMAFPNKIEKFPNLAKEVELPTENMGINTIEIAAYATKRRRRKKLITNLIYLIKYNILQWKNLSGRLGGRNARKAKRAAALPEDMMPVKAGEKGGRFKLLDEKDMKRINDTVLNVLETIGLANAIPSCIEACTAIGCKVSSEGRLLFPSKVVNESLEKGPARRHTLRTSSKHDLQLSAKTSILERLEQVVKMLDPINRKYRESTAPDLYDIARAATLWSISTSFRDQLSVEI